MQTSLPANEVSAIVFILLGQLAEESLFERDLRKKLSDLGWNPPSGHSALYIMLARLEKQGLVLSTSVKGERVCQLTRAGYARWCEQFDFYWTVSRRWARLRHKQPSGFVTLNGRTPRAEQPPVSERSATDAEHSAIMSAAAPALRAICEFSRIARVRAVDLVNARIECISYANSALTLEERSDSGRIIEQRLVKLSGEAKRLLRQASGRRVKGRVFLRSDSGVWTFSNLSAAFRRARRKAGVPDEVSLSGRGGKVGWLLEREAATVES
jgi:hypothetical protein